MNLTASQIKPRHRLSHAGYAGILRLIVDCAGHISSHEIATRATLSVRRARIILQAFHKHGLVFITGSCIPAGKNKHSLCYTYAFGSCADAVVEDKPRHKTSGPTPPELLTFIHIIKALQNESHTRTSLAEDVGIQPKTSGRLLRVLHKLRLVSIESFYIPIGRGHRYPSFRFGIDKVDAPKPMVKTPKELWTKYNNERLARRRDAKLLGLIVDRRTSIYKRSITTQFTNS
jgi:hypothetical protein